LKPQEFWRRKGEKEEKEEEEGGRDGSSTKKKDKTSLFSCFWSKIVLRKEF
jgi:hypothetical protein